MSDHKEVLACYRDYPQDSGSNERIEIEANLRARYKEARDEARRAT